MQLMRQAALLLISVGGFFVSDFCCYCYSSCAAVATATWSCMVRLMFECESGLCGACQFCCKYNTQHSAMTTHDDDDYNNNDDGDDDDDGYRRSFTRTRSLAYICLFACCCCLPACLLANPELFKVYTCRNFLKKVQLPQQSHSLSVSDAFGLYTTAALYTYIHTNKQTDVSAYPYICGEYKTV